MDVVAALARPPLVEEAPGLRPGRVLADAEDAVQVARAGREGGRVQLVHRSAVSRAPPTAKRRLDPPVWRVVLDWCEGAVDADALVGRTVSRMSCVMDVIYVGVLCRYP